MSAAAVSISAAGRPALSSCSWPVQATAVAAGVAILSASSHVAVPMVPVPITLQTLAVTLIGALFGWRLGAATVIAWLGLGALGLPVLAGVGGVARFMGPTAGYLFAFPLAAALAGALAQRGWDGARPGRAFLNMLVGNAACLVVGWAWLSVSLGAGAAFAVGVAPFLIGAVLKAGLGAVILAGFAPWAAHRATARDDAATG